MQGYEYKRGIENDASFKILKLAVSELQERYELKVPAIVELLQQGDSLAVPATLFSERRLSALECLVKYLKENKGLRYNEIGRAIGRDQRVVWTTYRNAVRKMSSELHIPATTHYAPLAVFSARKLSVLEALSTYLREECKITNQTIAVLTGRNNRTIWTVYERSKKKRMRLHG